MSNITFFFLFDSGLTAMAIASALPIHANPVDQITYNDPPVILLICDFQNNQHVVLLYMTKNKKNDRVVPLLMLIIFRNFDVCMICFRNSYC